MTTDELVKQYLTSEGYKYNIDSDGDIHFKYEGTDLFFTIDRGDNSFFRLIMPAIYKVDNNRYTVLEAANTVTRDMKVIKAFLVGDMLWLSIEMFLDTSPELDDFFPRCMALLKAGRERIAREIFK